MPQEVVRANNCTPLLLCAPHVTAHWFPATELGFSHAETVHAVVTGKDNGFPILIAFVASIHPLAAPPICPAVAVSDPSMMPLAWFVESVLETVVPSPR